MNNQSIHEVAVLTRNKNKTLDYVIRSVCRNEYLSASDMRKAIWDAISTNPEFLLKIMGGSADKLLTTYMARMNPPVESDEIVKSERERIAYRRDVAASNAHAFKKMQEYKNNNPDAFNFNRVLQDIKNNAVVEYKNSILAKFVINGQKLGEISPREAFQWMDAQNQKVTFIDMLLSGVSLHDNRMIKDIISAAEADKLWIGSGGTPI